MEVFIQNMHHISRTKVKELRYIIENCTSKHWYKKSGIFSLSELFFIPLRLSRQKKMQNLAKQ